MRAQLKRKTRETSVEVKLNLRGSGRSKIKTTLPMLDHLLETLAKHASMDLEIKASGDTHVDEHHLMEDIAIVLGKAIAKALGTRAGIARFGYAIVPFDESVAFVGADASGRGVLIYDCSFAESTLKGIDIDNFRHFFDTLARASGINLYMRCEGSNAHHKIEVLFKALALSLKQCFAKARGIRSTKRKLEVL